jgi:hypothetical protein
MGPSWARSFADAWVQRRPRCQQHTSVPTAATTSSAGQFTVHSPRVVAFTIAIPSVFESPSDPRILSSLPIQGSIRQAYCPCWNLLYSALHCGPNSSANVPTNQPSSNTRLTQGMQHLGLDECRAGVKCVKQQIHQMFAILEVARVLRKLGRE